MIDFLKEKVYSTQEMKKNILKHDITQNIFRIPKFQCCCIHNDYYDNRLIIYLGLSNGSIISIIIYRQRSLYNKLEEILLYTYPKHEKHDDAINALLLIKIHDNQTLLSAGTDGTIKMWSGEPELREKDMVHFIDTIYHERSTVTEFIYFEKRKLIIGIFSDIKIRVLAIEDYFDQKKVNRIRLTLSSIIEFNVKVNPNKDKQYLITTLSLKESDIDELFVGDNKGNIMIYHFIDNNYLKYQNSSEKLNLSDESKFTKNAFNFIKKINLHKKFGVIKIVHSNYDNVFYSSGYDNHIICYNTKSEIKVFDILNSNTKTHITNMHLNSYHRELIFSDDNGNTTFINIFNKTDCKNKPMKNKIIAIEPAKIFPKQEHILFMTETELALYKIIRKTKVSITRHHDAEIMKIFVIEPVLYEGSITEDSKVISIGYDKKIKVWDFLTMECMSEINGPELPKIAVTISSVRYLNDSQLIAIGSECGKMFFWDLVNSEYLPITYEEKYSHKSIITDIICFMSSTKEKNIKMECMLSCSTDGLILFWEINKMEIKDNKKKNTFNYDKSDDFIMNELKKRDRRNKMKQELDLNKYLQQENRKELKLYKCSPSIKRCINTLKILKCELKFNVLAFQEYQNNMTIFSGMNDNHIYLWDYKKETYIDKSEGNNIYITCMMVDKNFLFSGGTSGFIDIWSIFLNESNKINIKLINSIKDPSMTRSNIPRINDLILLPKIGILVFCNNNKKLYFYNLDKNSMITQIQTENELTCTSCLESYGKLLCGTKQKMIIEINLNEVLKPFGYKELYDKYPFTKNPANYERNILDSYINNFKIMKSLTDDQDVFNFNEEK
jgi:WD40 repeat protein